MEQNGSSTGAPAGDKKAAHTSLNDDADPKQARTSPARFLINMISSLGTRILQLTALLWANQYILRRVEVEEYAIFAVIVSMMIVADLFKMIFTGGLSRFMVEADANNDTEEITRITSSMTPVLLLVTLVIAGVGTLAVFYIDVLIKVSPAYIDDAQIMLALLVANTCANVMSTPFTCGLFVRQQFVKLNVLKLAVEVLRICVLYYLLVYVSPQALWLIVATSLGNAVNIAVQTGFTLKLFPTARVRRAYFSKQTAKRLMHFGAWTSVGGIAQIVSRTAPILLLNRFGSGADASAFYLGRLPDIKIRDLLQSAAQPAKPALTSIYALEGEAALEEFYYRGGRYYLWAALLLAAPLLVFADPIISLYTNKPDYADAAVVLAISFGIYPILWASAMYYQVAFAIGRIGAYNICNIALQAITFLMLILFIWGLDQGAVGAAKAIALSHGLVTAFLLWPMGLRLVKGRWTFFARQTVAPGIAPFLAALVACLVYRNFITVNSWMLLGAGALVSTFVYGAVLVTCRDDVDKRLSAKFVSKAVNKGAILARALPFAKSERRAG